jgi:hypothetical protein
MGDELVPESQMKRWHNDRGKAWGTTFEGPEPILIARMELPGNLTVHLANQHGLERGAVIEMTAFRHLWAHLYAQFREGQEHYHEMPKGMVL